MAGLKSNAPSAESLPLARSVVKAENSSPGRLLAWIYFRRNPNETFLGKDWTRPTN